VIVDVLSFSTCVDVALARGAAILPLPMGRADAADFARERNAALAVHRGETDERSPYSLSPLSLSRAIQGERVVLPSPNGSALSFASAELCPRVYTACLRNASAVARRLAHVEGLVLVVAAGERWDGATGPLRPAFEDLVGAGAVLAGLEDREHSPGARAAVGAFRAVAGDLKGCMKSCQSGRELIERGFAGDVAIASEFGASETVPRFLNGAFVDECG
jgi:2-phosphosulfolactate phosphatase